MFSLITDKIFDKIVMGFDIWGSKYLHLKDCLCIIRRSNRYSGIYDFIFPFGERLNDDNQ